VVSRLASAPPDLGDTTGRLRASVVRVVERLPPDSPQGLKFLYSMSSCCLGEEGCDMRGESSMRKNCGVAESLALDAHGHGPGTVSHCVSESLSSVFLVLAGTLSLSLSLSHTHTLTHIDTEAIYV
jgi:hypothetical protein